MKQLVKLASNRYSLAIIQNVYVKDGVAMATDVDNVLTYPCDKPDGLYSAKGIAAGAWVKSELDISDYPSEAILMGDKRAIKTVDVDSLAWVARAMSSEETRYYICTVNIHNAGIVATDGHRLHLVKSESDMAGEYLVPSDAVKIILACAKEEKADSLAFTFSESAFSVTIGKYFVKGKLCSATFPDYRRVIPAKLEHKTVYKHKELAAVAKEVRALHKANGAPRSRPVKFTAEGLRVMAGEFSKDFPTSSNFGEREIGFNFDYLEDIGLNGVLRYEDSIGPVRIDDGDKVAVLMPLRV